jgi:hypothetical protein
MESTPGRCHCERCSRPVTLVSRPMERFTCKSGRSEAIVVKGPPHIVICPAIAVQHAEHPGGSQLPNFPCALGRYREGRYGHIAIFGSTTKFGRNRGKADISLAAHRVDWLKAAKDEALGVERNFTRNLQTLPCIRRQLRSLILQPLARRADMIRRNESTGWRVTPSAPTRPCRLCRKLIVVEVSVSSATVSRSCGGGASRASYPT